MYLVAYSLQNYILNSLQISPKFIFNNRMACFLEKKMLRCNHLRLIVEKKTRAEYGVRHADCWLISSCLVWERLRIFFVICERKFVNFLYCMKFRCFEGEENFQFIYSRITFAQNRYSLLICSVWILSNLFSFSCCLFDLYKDSKKSSTVCFYSASYHWKVCDGFIFNLPWLWYFI